MTGSWMEVGATQQWASRMLPVWNAKVLLQDQYEVAWILGVCVYC
jgi:hypothetical protein